MKYIRRLLVPIVLVLGIRIAASYLPFWRPAYWQSRSSLQSLIEQQKADRIPVRFSDWEDLDPAGYEIGKRVEDLLNQLVAPSSEIILLLDSQLPLTSDQIATLRKHIERNVEVVSKLKSIESIQECRFRHDFRKANSSRCALAGDCNSGFT